MSTNMEDLVKTYLVLRNEREQLKIQYENKDAELEGEMKLLEQAMLVACNDVNATSIKTQHGTVIKSLKERYTIADRDYFNEFVKENMAVELFEGRIHQGNFKQFMSEHKDEGLPPGVNVMREFAITVRKPSANLSTSDI